jgi:hypothetical protein
MRTLALATVLLLCSVAACGPKGPSMTVYVDPPPDGNCIGVVGYEVHFNSRVSVGMNPSPSLTFGDCIVPPISLDDLGVDASLFITVTGYDSAHGEVVKGSARVGSLNAPQPARVALQHVQSTDVLVIDRAQLLQGAPLADVVEMRVARSPPQGDSLATVSINDTTRPFFLASEPATFVVGVPLSLADHIDVNITMRSGAPIDARRLNVTRPGDYFAAGP